MVWQKLPTIDALLKWMIHVDKPPHFHTESIYR